MTVSAAVFSTPCPLAQARMVGKLESWKVEESSVLALQLFNSSTFQRLSGGARGGGPPRPAWGLAWDRRTGCSDVHPAADGRNCCRGRWPHRSLSPGTA